MRSIETGLTAEDETKAKRQWIDEFNPAIAMITCYGTEILNLLYRISFDGMERIRELSGRGFILLPNHQSYLDIILEGLLLRRSSNLYARYVMKDNIPIPNWYLRRLGGIPITRPNEINRDCDTEQRRADLTEAKKTRDYIYKGVLCDLIRDSGVAVIHPQGTRRYKGEFKPEPTILTNLIRTQRELSMQIPDMQIPFVPLTISYENIYKFMSKIQVSVGEVIFTGNGGREELASRLCEQMRVHMKYN